MIKANNISVAIGGKKILKSVNFHANAGEVTAIVGPNGSGKSTLIKALTDEVPWTGSITVNDKLIGDYLPWELAAIRGVLPQAMTLAFPFTVVEIMRLGLTAGTHGQNTSLIERALDCVGLNSYANRHFQDLSGGEQQRAHLARVLCQVWEPIVAGEPRWLLLDEPVSSLDIAHQLLVMEQLRSYAKRGGGVIAVMHDLNLTAMVADQTAIVHQGQILDAGPTREIFNDATLSKAYSCKLRTNSVPANQNSFVLPHAAQIVGY